MARPLLKDYFSESKTLNNRIIVASVIIVLLTFAVISRLFYLQILSYDHYTTLSKENLITLVPIPPQRGVIYDRNGIVLAQDAPAFSIEVTPDKIENIDVMLQALGEVVSLSDREVKIGRAHV